MIEGKHQPVTAMSMFTQEEQTQLIDLSRTFTKNLTELINKERED